MKVAQAIKSFNDYHLMNSKKNTIENYEFVIPRFQSQFQSRELESITPDEILSFLSKITDGTKQSTKKQRYSLLRAFFNFVIDTRSSL